MWVHSDRFSDRIVSMESEIERLSQWSTADRVGEEWILEYRHGNNRLITGHYPGGQSGSSIMLISVRGQLHQH